MGGGNRRYMVNHLGGNYGVFKRVLDSELVRRFLQSYGLKMISINSQDTDIFNDQMLVI
jgi:ABC-type transport system involved in Fe-S cluster assembly fused permease/ATPase subunit